MKKVETSYSPKGMIKGLMSESKIKGPRPKNKKRKPGLPSLFKR